MNFNWTEIVLAIIAIASGVITHLLDKRKHKAEIAKLTAETASDNITNMDKSLDFYEKLAESTNKRLDAVLAKQEEMIQENEALKTQVTDLNTKMTKINAVICTKLACVHREVDESVLECIYPDTPKTKKQRKVKIKKV